MLPLDSEVEYKVGADAGLSACFCRTRVHKALCSNIAIESNEEAYNALKAPNQRTKSIAIVFLFITK